MKFLIPKYLVQATLFSLSAAVLILPAGGHAAPPAPALAGPSVVSLGSKATYRGRYFVPGATLRVQTQEEGGAPYHVYVVASDKGVISHQVNPSLDGPLTITVFDASENELAKANAMVTR
jgi:hypothetical protein